MGLFRKKSNVPDQRLLEASAAVATQPWGSPQSAASFAELQSAGGVGVEALLLLCSGTKLGVNGTMNVWTAIAEMVDVSVPYVVGASQKGTRSQRIQALIVMKAWLEVGANGR